MVFFKYLCPPLCFSVKKLPFHTDLFQWLHKSAVDNQSCFSHIWPEKAANIFQVDIGRGILGTQRVGFVGCAVVFRRSFGGLPIIQLRSELQETLPFERDQRTQFGGQRSESLGLWPPADACLRDSLQYC